MSIRSLVIASGVSLLLNVFLVGIIAGHYYAAGDEPRQGRRAGGPIPAIHVDALPPGQRQQFAAAMAAHRPAIRAAREASRAQRLALTTDIAAPVFDRAKVAGDFDALRQAVGNVSIAVDAGILDALATLPADARAALVSPKGGGKPPARP